MSRKLSWMIATIAYVGAPVWAWFAIASDRDAQMSAYGFVKCGTPMIGIILWACILAGASSLLALGLGTASFRKMPSPRPRMRVLEIGALSIPLVLAIFTSAYILWA
jgi:hypothetical protein